MNNRIGKHPVTAIHSMRGAIWRSLAFVAALASIPALGRGQQLYPLMSNGAGQIGAVASAQVAQDQFVTAVLNGSGNLEVIVWLANYSTNQLVRQGSATAGRASAVAVTSLYSLNWPPPNPCNGCAPPGTAVTAAINANGNLDLIEWQVQPNGAISLVSEVESDSATSVSIAAVDWGTVMTAIRNGAGNLEVTYWWPSPPALGLVHGNGTAYAGAISEVSIVGGGDGPDPHGSNWAVTAFTAVRNGAGDQEIIQWMADYNGIWRGPSAYLGPVNQIVAATPSFSGGYYQTAFFTATVVPPGNIEVYPYFWLGTASLDLYGTVFGYQSNQVSLVASNTAALVAGIDQYGTSFVQVFDWTGSSFAPVAYAPSAYASAISVAMVDYRSPNFTIVALAYRNSAGNLQIQLWNYTPACAPGCPYASAPWPIG